MNKNRRNYYRILQVQPDAAPEVIKSNYRTLLQKLRLHPDLGGEEWNAVLINEAYNILRHPEKRKAYDKQLLNLHNIEQLSLGNLHHHTPRHKPAHKSKLSSNNQRNFYRLLDVQPDAPDAIIRASYLTLRNKSPQAKHLLKEAYSILGNPAKRKLYDQLLLRHMHAEAIHLLFNDKHKGQTGKQLAIHNPSIRTQPVSARQTRRTSNTYEPQIIHYCCFCKTPYTNDKHQKGLPRCIECDSPLYPPPRNLLEQSRRDLTRISRSGEVHYYTYWPGEACLGRLADISPTGLRLLTPTVLEKASTLKLVGDGFTAVGNVTHRQSEYDGYSSGIRFMTVEFEKQKGHFISASA